MGGILALFIWGVPIGISIWLYDKLPLNAKTLKESELTSIYKILRKVVVILRILLFLLPFVYSIFYGLTEVDSSISTFYKITIGVLYRGIALAAVSIPIHFIFDVIDIFILSPLSYKKENKILQKHRNKQIELEKMNRIRIEEEKAFALQSANNSLGVLNSPDMQEKLEQMVLRHRPSTIEITEELTPTIVRLPSTEHYDFMNNQIIEITRNIRSIILNSKISIDSNLRVLAGNKESSIDNFIHFAVKELESKTDLPQNVEQLLNMSNSVTFFNSLYNYCKKNNIDMSQDYSRVIVSKSEKYKNAFLLMNDKLKRQFGIARKGFAGEDKVSQHLALYNDVLINLENIVFRVDKDTTETVEADNIVICENGIFCIETKNHGKVGQTIKVTKDGLWKRIKGGIEEEMDNVSEQHNRHIGNMQKIVNQELKNRGINVPYIFFEPLYIIANDEVEIQNQSDEIKLLRTSSIYPYISKFQPKYTLSKELQEIIRDIILDKKEKLKKYPVSDYKQLFTDYFSAAIKDIENKELISKIYKEYIDIIESLYTIKINEIYSNKYISIE